MVLGFRELLEGQIPLPYIHNDLHKLTFNFAVALDSPFLM